MAGSPAPASAKGTGHHSHRSRHVLLLSVDGLHQSDLARYVSQHHHSALAALVKRGTEFTHARTPFPLDSFPGMVGQLTGGNPRTTGVYYDVSYNQWSDKHPAYEILNGPSGTGLDDLFAPEINSNADRAGNDWTSVNSLTRQYDDYKVQAVLNEIRGDDHRNTRRRRTGNLRDELPVRLHRREAPHLRRAGRWLQRQRDRARAAAAERARLRRPGADHHRQGPQGRRRARLDDGDPVGQARPVAAGQPVAEAHQRRHGHRRPQRGLGHCPPGRTPAAGGRVAERRRDAAVVQQRGPLRAGRRLRQRLPRRLQRDRGRHRRARQGHRHQQGPGRYTAAGLAKVYAGSNAASFIGTDPSDERVPDLIGIVQHGVVYTGKTKKIAEHGGNDPQDRDVPLVISGPSIKHRVQTTQVQTTQIAPTILSLLGLDPHDLEAVVAEGTRGLPLR